MVPSVFTVEECGKVETMNIASRLSFVTLAAALLIAGNVLAQDAPRQYERSRAYDMEHVALDIRLDLEKSAVIGTATLRIAPIGEAIAKAEFDAVDFEVHSVTNSAGASLDYRNSGEAITVYFPEPIPVGESQTVSIEYEAIPERGLYFRTAAHGYRAAPNIWSQGEAEDNRHWFPSYDYPNDRATSEITVHVPNNLRAYANGVLASKTENNDGTTTYHWRQNQPHTNYLISLVVGDYTEIEEEADGTTLRYIVRPQFAENASFSFSKTRAMLDYFESYIDIDYPYDDYSQIAVVDFIFGGMENTSITTLTERTLHGPDAHLTYSSDGLVAHELAHQWWGDLLTCKDWSQLWLNEGFATYFAAMFERDDRGQNDFDYRMLRLKESYFELETDDNRIPVVRTQYSDPNEAINRRVYNKGAWILHMLRARYGDARFQEAIRLYTARNVNTAVETSDLFDVFEELSGDNLERFIDEWLLAAGYPKLKARYTWDDESKTALITITQTQTVDETTPLFHLDVPVETIASGETVRRTVSLDDKEASISIALPSRPEMVTIDPDGVLLASVDFDPGKSLVLKQITHPSMLARIEACERLAEFKTDDAFNALKTALQSDAFWGVRARAATAIGTMERGDTATALAAAFQSEKDARVRVDIAEAAATALPRDTAEKMLTETIQNDPSPYVVAEALETLGKLHAEGAGNIVVKAVDRESHNDVVRIRALSAAADLALTQTPRLAEKYLEPNHDLTTRRGALAAYVTYARNTGTESDALDALVRYLDDPNRGVRLAVIQGLGALGIDQALAHLERMRDSGATDRERKAATAAISTIRDKRSVPLELRELRESLDELKEDNRELREKVDTLTSTDTAPE